MGLQRVRVKNKIRERMLCLQSKLHAVAFKTPLLDGILVLSR